MGHKIGRRGAFLLLCLAVANEAGAARVIADNVYSDDSDHAKQWRSQLGLDQRLAQGIAGIRIGPWKINDAAGEEHFNALSLRYDTDPSRQWRSRVGITQLSGDWSPTLGDVSTRYKSSGPWYVEASAQREIIDTVTAIRMRHSTNTYSASADYAISPAFTLVGAFYTQSISDGNNRTGKLARAIYSFPSVEGLTLQGRFKLIDSDFRGTGYFSPLKLQEFMAIIGYSRSILGERWSVGAQLGTGAQSVDDTDNTSLLYGELKFKGWFSERLGFDAKASCSNTGGFSAAQSDTRYRFCIGALSMITVW